MKFGSHAAIVLFTLLLAASVAKPVVAADGFVTFEDLLERAFRLEVPTRRTVRGGMFRLGYSDFRPMLDLESPDGKSSIRSGDVAVPRAYALPTAFHSTDGEVDDLGAQARFVYATYRTGNDYAKLYAWGASKHSVEA